MRRRLPRRSSPRLVSFVADIFSHSSDSAPPRASIDNIRLWNVAEVGEFDRKVKSGIQFKIIAGHHGGFVSQMSAFDLPLPTSFGFHPVFQSLTRELVSL
jgi:hypothetical protein